MGKERMIGRRPILIALALVLIAVAIGGLALMGGAAEPKPTLAIAGTSLSFKDNIYMNFYVSAENADELKLLIWEAPQSEYRIGTEQYALTDSAASNGYKRFVFDEFAARQMTKEVYACAHTNVGGVDYYSDPFKFSMHTYAYGIINGGSAYSESMKALCREMLDYGAAAQVHFDGATARLANDNWLQITVSGGLLSDGTRKGLYLQGDTINVTAPEVDSDGAAFFGWVDSEGNILAETAAATLTVGDKSDTYRASYASLNGFSIVYPEKSSNAMAMSADNLYTRLADEGELLMNVSANDQLPTDRYIAIYEADQFEALYGISLAYNDYCIKPISGKTAYAIGGGGIYAIEAAIKNFSDCYAAGGYKAIADLSQINYVFTATPQSGVDRMGQITSVYNDANGRMMSMSHRGDHQNYPENSLGAFQSCIDGGVDIIEIDVWKTSDNQFVVIHDNTLARTTNASGSNATADVRNMSLSTIQSYTLRMGLGGSSSTVSYSDSTWNRVPSLAEVFRLCRGKIMISIDKINTVDNMIAIKNLADSCGFDASGLQFKCAISEFTDTMKNQFLAWGDGGPEFMPLVSGANYQSVTDKLNTLASYGVDINMIEFLGIQYHHSDDCYRQLRNYANSKGMRLLFSSIYTQDDPGVWGDCYDIGIGAVMTDHPVDLARYINSVSSTASSFDTIRAADVVGCSGVNFRENGQYGDFYVARTVNGVSNGDWIRLPYINFTGHETAVTLSAKIFSDGFVKLYADSVSPENLLSTIALTAGKDGFVTVNAPLVRTLSGSHQLVLAFEGNNEHFAELDLISFRTGDTSTEGTAYISYTCYKHEATLPEKVTLRSGSGRPVELAVSWNGSGSYAVGRHTVTGTASDGTSVVMTFIVEDAVVISNASEWNSLASSVASGNNYKGKYVVLANDIDFSGTSFTAIGNESTPFRGEFDGNGKTLSNITASARGAFDHVRTGAYIHDLNLDNCHFSTSSALMGSMIGRMFGGAVDNCHVNNCSVTSNSSNFGGIGGFVGHIGNENGQDISISNCTVTATKTDAVRDIGGFVGRVDSGFVLNCSATDVKIVSTGNSVGGFAGTVNGGQFMDCYSHILSKVQGSGAANIGAFTGYNTNNPSAVDNIGRVVYVNCTWDSSRTGLPAIGTNAGNGYLGYMGPKASEAMPDCIPEVRPEEDPSTSFVYYNYSTMSDAILLADFDTKTPTLETHNSRGDYKLTEDRAYAGKGLMLYAKKDAANGEGLCVDSSGNTIAPELSSATLSTPINIAGYKGLLYHIDTSETRGGYMGCQRFLGVAVPMWISNKADGSGEDQIRGYQGGGYYYEDGRWVPTVVVDDGLAYKLLIPSYYSGWIYIPLSSYSYGGYNNKDNASMNYTAWDDASEGGWTYLTKFTIYTDYSTPNSENGLIEVVFDNVYIVK